MDEILYKSQEIRIASVVVGSSLPRRVRFDGQGFLPLRILAEPRLRRKAGLDDRGV